MALLTFNSLETIVLFFISASIFVTFYMPNVLIERDGKQANQ